MADTLTTAQRSDRMSRIKGKGTKTELTIRRLIHRLGYRYRLHKKDLPGQPDMVFARHKAVIFIHGCFWHRHPDPKCPLARLPKSRLTFWQHKLDSNRTRDIRVEEELKTRGWRVLVIWECQLRERSQLETIIREFLG